MRGVRSTAIVALIAFFAANQAVKAQSVADFYRGKQIRFIVAFAAGTDYDTWARLIARHLGDHIPGRPAVVVEDMPAAGGIVAANDLYNIAEHDGTVIGIIGRNLPYEALVQDQGIRFDPVKFNYLGSPELTNRVCVAYETAPVKKAEDLFTTQLLTAGNGAGSAVSTTPVLLNKLLGMKFKLVEGYKAPADSLLAMERGEVEGICSTIMALRTTRPDWLTSGKLKILFNTEHNPVPEFHAPSVFDFVKTDEQKRILTLYTSSVELGRPIVAPPDVPADRLAALRKGLAEAMQDPALKDEARQQKLDINVVAGDTLTSLVAELMSTPREFVDKMKADLQ
jgi:tripartite-type tricarboxylate transporter receptor subunit TctC